MVPAHSEWIPKLSVEFHITPTGGHAVSHLPATSLQRALGRNDEACDAVYGSLRRMPTK